MFSPLIKENYSHFCQLNKDVIVPVDVSIDQPPPRRENVSPVIILHEELKGGDGDCAFVSNVMEIVLLYRIMSAWQHQRNGK